MPSYRPNFNTRQRLAPGRHAFTLIELLIVILIIAILIAVALPAFLGQTSKAQDSATWQRLTVATTEAKALWTSSGQQAFPLPTSQTVQSLNSSEPGYGFMEDDSIADSSDTSTTGTTTIGTYVGTGSDPSASNIITFCQQSQSGTFFCERIDELSGLLNIAGANDIAAPASADSVSLAPTSASADGPGYTDVVRAAGPTEASAICVLDAATPAPAGSGTGTIGPSCQAQGGQASWGSTQGSDPASGSDSTPSAVPGNTTIPSISGDAYVGATLTASPGAWTGNPSSYTYQWERCNVVGADCQAIGAASANAAYIVQGADDGATIEVTVTASNSGGPSATVASEPTATVIGAPAIQLLPSITGSVNIGSELSISSNGSWTDTDSSSTYAYQWYRCTDAAAQDCTAIAGSAGQQSSYTLQDGDGGDWFVAYVTATNEDTSSAPAESNILGPIVGVPAGGAPAIAGNAYVGAQLRGSVGSWSYSPVSYNYQWEDCTASAETNCTPISGASGTLDSPASTTTYTVQSSDDGDYIALIVAATNAAGTGTAATSQATAQVMGAPSGGSVAIAGTAAPGSTLTGSTSGWSDSPTSYSYQWEDCTAASDGTCTAISGATGSTYTVQVADDGDYIGVAVSATNAAGTSAPISTVLTSATAPPALTEVGSYAAGSKPFGVAYSPNSAYLAVANESADSVETYSVGAGGALTELATYASVDGPAITVAFSPNGDYLAVTEGAEVVIYNVGSGETLTEQGAYVTGTGASYSVAFSPNGAYLAATNYSSDNVETYSVGSGGALTEVGSYTTGTEPQGVAFSPNGTTLAVANTASNTVETYSVGSGGGLTEVGAYAGPIVPWMLAFSPNGGLLAVGTENASQTDLGAFTVGSSGVLTNATTTLFTDYGGELAFSPNGDYLALNGNRLTLFTVSATNALTPLGISSAFSGEGGVAFSPNGAYVAATGGITSSTVTVYTP